MSTEAAIDAITEFGDEFFDGRDQYFMLTANQSGIQVKRMMEADIYCKPRFMLKPLVMCMRGIPFHNIVIERPVDLCQVSHSQLTM